MLFIFMTVYEYTNIYIYFILVVGILVINYCELRSHEHFYTRLLVYLGTNFCWVHMQATGIAGS